MHWCSRCWPSWTRSTWFAAPKNGEWLLSRDLDELTLAELYEACQLRIPIAEAHAAVSRRCARALGRVAALDELRIPLRELLKRRVSSIHAEPES